MIELCCDEEASASYSSGALPLEEIFRVLNPYTTTLHAINSAVIKLGKLTAAKKVYRGIQGKSLPEQFWSANEFGVKGGVEKAFMSTTLDSRVAMRYAGGPDASGICFEVQQGMVDRGADLSWLSQYPHEQEILFGPLTGLEVQSTRVAGSIVCIQTRLSVNLASLTLEQVISKRHRMLCEMRAGMGLDLRSKAFAEGASHGYSASCATFVCDLLTHCALEESTEWYNDDNQWQVRHARCAAATAAVHAAITLPQTQTCEHPHLAPRLTRALRRSCNGRRRSG